MLENLQNHIGDLTQESNVRLGQILWQFVALIFSISHTIKWREVTLPNHSGDMTQETSVRCQSEDLDANILAICSRRGRSYGVCSGM